MYTKRDKLSKKLIKIVLEAGEPLETKEILEFSNETRVKVLYRLHNLRGEGLIKGKLIGSGKGAWIWWRKDAF